MPGKKKKSSKNRRDKARKRKADANAAAVAAGFPNFRSLKRQAMLDKLATIPDDDPLHAKYAVATGYGAYGVPRRLRGKGGFWSDLWGSVKGGLGTAVGSGLAMVGQHILSGGGAYTSPWSVQANSLTTKEGIPMMHNTGQSTRVIHIEMIGPVKSSTGFVATRYRFNPGVDTIMPWLSSVARNYQQYVVRGLVLTFTSAIPDGTASFTSLGKLMICPYMNVNQPIPVDDSQLEQTQFAISAKPSEDIICPIECAPELGGNGLKNVRTSEPSDGDYNPFDHCNVVVATNGQPSTGVIMGYLKWSYDIELLNPTYLGQGAGNNWLHSYGTGVTALLPLGSAPATSGGLAGNNTCDAVVTPTTITLPVGTRGRWKLSYLIQGSGAASNVVHPTITLTNAAGLVHQVAGYDFPAPENAVVALVMSRNFYFYVQDPDLPVVITFGTGGTMPAGTPFCTLDLNQIPPDAN